MIYLASVNEITDINVARTEKLLAKVAGGDTDALSDLYENTKASVYGFALSILKNTHDAEDVLHDCYVAVWNSAGSYKPMGKPLAWLLTITRNLCLKKIKEKDRNQDIPEDWDSKLEEVKGITEVDKLVIRECMNRLSDEERQIVMLHAVAGFKHREIGEMLDIALPTVISKYNRALKKLRDILE